MDYGRIFDAVLNGAAQRPRRTTRKGTGTRRGTGPFGMTQAETRQIGRAIGALASIAADALSRPTSHEPAPRAPQGRIPDIAPAGPLPIPPPRPSPWRIPDTGRAPEAPPPPAAGAEHAEAMLLLRAMIAASRADGAVDRTERTEIAKRLDAAGLTVEERDRVLEDFDRPASIEELARGARDPMLAAQLYAAAFGAVGEVSDEERAWLDRLGQALKLDKAALSAIEKRLST
ncbi:DUF533 domain-containing protein [Roseococcus sp. YIM B11640]|uniref:DUF533 domain-containing protein n=1 Tax=Roseococcus sp. YIM B11640 TaxID=3133973 RepID=UPI003C7D7CC8